MRYPDLYNLLPHHYAECLTSYPPEQMKLLAADIRANGLRVPILLYQGKILDGTNRYKACKIAAYEFNPSDFVEYTGTDPLGEVVSLNAVRRHLTKSQLACLAQEIASAKHGGSHRPISVDGTEELSMEEAAEKLGIASSRTMVVDARKLFNTDPRVYNKVKTGEIPNVRQGMKRVGLIPPPEPKSAKYWWKNIPKGELTSEQTELLIEEGGNLYLSFSESFAQHILPVAVKIRELAMEQIREEEKAAREIAAKEAQPPEAVAVVETASARPNTQ